MHFSQHIVHAQMRFHHKHRRAHSIRLVLESARANAVNTFGMDASRLYVGARIVVSLSHAFVAGTDPLLFRVPFAPPASNFHSRVFHGVLA
jgi:hypothetical protein